MDAELPDAPWAASLPDAPWAGGKQFSALQSGMAGAAEGATFGFAPALEGVAAASRTPNPSTIAERSSGAAALRPIQGAWNLLRGSPEAKAAYTKGRQDALQEQTAAAQQHPFAYGTGQVAGSLAALPVVPELGAASIPGRIGAGAAVGAGAAGLTGLGESVSEGAGAADTAKRVAADTALGGVFGGAGAGVAEAVSPLASRAVSAWRAFRDPEAEASRQALTAMAEDWRNAGKTWQPLTPEQTAAANAAGTPRAIVDVMGPQTRALAEWSAMNSPNAQRNIEMLTGDRLKEQAPRIAGFIQNMTGGGDLAADTEAVQAAARAANKPAYRAAYAAGDRPLWSPELERLSGSPDVRDALQTAAKTGKSQAISEGFGGFNPSIDITPDGRLLFTKNAPAGQKPLGFWDRVQQEQNFGPPASVVSSAKGGEGVPTYPNLQFWDYTRRNLSDAASQAFRAGRNSEGGRLSTQANDLNAELDRLVPEYNDARRGAASFFGAKDALEAGSKFVSAGTNLSMGKAQMALNKMSAPEQELFARGYATELATRIQKSGDSRNTLNSAFLSNPVAKARTEMALGPQNARDLESLLRAEEVVNSTRNLYLGSPTARRLALQGTMGVGFAGAESYFDPTRDWSKVLLAGLAPALAGSARQVLNQRLATQLGTMLTSNNPAVFAKGVRLMSNNPTTFNALRKATAFSAGRAAPPVLNEASPIGGQQQNQRKRGGRVEKADRQDDGGRKQRQAHSGSLPRPFHPQSIGARKAKDGRWYIRDKSRPGKFLEVRPHV